MQYYNQANKNRGARESHYYRFGQYGEKTDAVVEGMYGREDRLKVMANRALTLLGGTDRLVEVGFDRSAVENEAVWVGAELKSEFGPGQAGSKHRATELRQMKRAIRIIEGKKR